MVKAVTFFLIFILVLAMLGRLRFPKLKSPFGRGRLNRSAKCENCGRYLVAGEACECRK